ncbi:MAG: DUF1326 domain-containing protein [Terriglobia bacterium]
MKKFSLIIGLLVVVVVVVGAMLMGEEPAWSLEGRIVAVDSCAVGCPCLLGEPPTHPTCQLVEIWRIDKGQFGEVVLDDTSFAMAAEFSHAAREAPRKYHFSAFYIDTGANPEQKQALRNILAEPPFADFGEPVEVREVAIGLTGMEAFGQVGKRYGGRVGDIARIELTTIGIAPDKPLLVENAAPGFPWVAVGKSSNSFYKSAGRNFHFEGTSGESGRFTLSGGRE